MSTTQYPNFAARKPFKRKLGHKHAAADKKATMRHNSFVATEKSTLEMVHIQNAVGTNRLMLDTLCVVVAM